MRIGALAIFCGAITLGLALQSCGDSEPEGLTDTAQTAREAASRFPATTGSRIPAAFATQPGTPWGDYVGSDACKQCHEDEYAKWRRSFHSRTLFDALPETVFGAFDGKQLKAGKGDKKFFSIRPYTETDERGRTRFFMEIRWLTKSEGGAGNMWFAETYGAQELPDLAPRRFEVVYAFGNRNHQPYVGRWPDGKHWVMPVIWNDLEKEWSFDAFRPYVRACANCHTTGIKNSETPYYEGQPPIPQTEPAHYNLSPSEEGWAEGAVGCENCHGPGRKHVEAVEREGVERYRKLRETDAKGPTIWDGLTARSPAHVADACGRCHNFHTESSCTWQPTPDGYERDPKRWPMHERAGNRHPLLFYRDGTVRSPCVVVEVFRRTKMHAEGVTCFDCHDPHGSKHWPSLTMPSRNNELCVSCHEAFASIDAQTAHSRHAAGSSGNRCVDCHMPRILSFADGVHTMTREIPEHSFSIPTADRRPGGPPSACNVCHHDRDQAWTRRMLQEMWPPDETGDNEEK